MTTYYKAVRLDRTSHYDGTTKWRKGAVVRAPNNLPIMLCANGIHGSKKLLDAVGCQNGPSLYCEFEPLPNTDESTGTDKSCFREVKVLRWLCQEDQDEMAGFKLYEANHAFNPLLHRQLRVKGGRDAALREWASVRTSVRTSVGALVRTSVRTSVGALVRTSVRTSVCASVDASVWASVCALISALIGASVWDSVRDSVGAYTGGLFPHITSWKYAETLGEMPWRPLLNLWYAGYVPSFDGTTWRLHAGRKAEVVHTWRP